MEYLQKGDIVLINKLTVERHGGNFVPPLNLLNESPLDYLIEAVEGKIFGQQMYPTIHDKAAFYMFSIISNHVFQDGNKRTGLEAALLFMKLNGYQLKEDLINVKYQTKDIPKSDGPSEQILFYFTMEVASGEVTLEECSSWFEANIKKI